MNNDNQEKINAENKRALMIWLEISTCPPVGVGAGVRSQQAY